MITKIQNLYGMTKMPFTKEIASNQMFVSNTMKEAVSRLHVAIQSEEGVMLCGTAGTGKSCILRKFTQEVDDTKYRVLYASGEFKNTGEIVKHLLFLMNESIPFHSSRAIRHFKNIVSQSNKIQGVKPIVIIDEAQELPDAALAGLKSIINYDMDSNTYLCLVLCGQPELKMKLRSSRLASLERRIRIKHSMVPLSLEETPQYIKHQIKAAGVDNQIFSDSAMSAVFDFSRGVISTINLLCYMALIKAGSEGKEIIDQCDIEVVRTQDR